MTTAEKNAAIARWMGLQTGKELGYDRWHQDWFDNIGVINRQRNEKLLFHSDWNWLCLVIEKIRELGYNVRFDMEDYFVMDNEGCDIAVEGINSGDSWIEGTFNIVYQFVVWHNQQVKETPKIDMEKLLFFEIVQFLMGTTFGHDHICYKQKIYYLDRGDHMNELHQLFQEYLKQKEVS